ncbi:peptidyl-tRNA hydrolase PTH2-domain-containing protein [Cristinia sonorae]|uniref:peptidyl-tRNA hydrolase n=1 Tax=Cristinia sonorae TaxID=1940300 RepID=A0A8K0XPN8_9AGAR|nr:peptidyl-tRNA hydrolase PTH2-domain-containing protein [Cristinia sonorae]
MSSFSSSQIAQGVALVAVSLSVGYALGASSFRTTSASPPPKQPEPPTEETEEEESGSEDEEDVADGDLTQVKPGMFEECKLVLVVRTDLKMTTGKIAAQCGHATLACYKSLMKVNPQLVQHWERTGQAKIALKATSEDELLELEAIAKSLNLCARSIQDAGRTQIAAGSRTVLGIGPGPVRLVNEVTGRLRLL